MGVLQGTIAHHSQYWQFSDTSHSKAHVLRLGRKPALPGANPWNTGRTCRLHTPRAEVEIKPSALEVWGNKTNMPTAKPPRPPSHRDLWNLLAIPVIFYFWTDTNTDTNRRNNVSCLFVCLFSERFLWFFITTRMFLLELEYHKYLGQIY